MLSSQFNTASIPSSLVKNNLLHFSKTIISTCGYYTPLIKIAMNQNTPRVMYRLGIIDTYSDINKLKSILDGNDFKELIIAMNIVNDLVGRRLLDFHDFSKILNS